MYAAWSSSDRAMTSKSRLSALNWRTKRTAQSRMVRLRRPRKSNFTRPAASTSSLSNWETALFSWPGWQYSGQKSVSLPGAMSTPPACIPMLRVRPSSGRARSTRARTSSSCS
ncbi:Uncharacterised protein [Bordetella pertussis]|nr:Uncharacterised protein [Bordetella pertussis]